MPPEPGRYLTPSSRNDRRRRKHARQRGLILTIVIIALAAAVAAWAILLPGLGRTATSTTTSSLRPGALTSTTTTPGSSSSTTTSSVAAITPTPTTLAAKPSTYSAQLSGQNENPAVTSSASGTLTLTVAADGSSVRYVLRLSKLSGVTLARLHEGNAGVSGSTVITLYGGPARSDIFSGVLTQGSFTAAKLGGPLKGKTVADFVALLKAGSIYLNVGTSSHPGGEIRGQLK